MTMANFRLPSGVYMKMLANAAADETKFISEYPTFPKHRGVGRRHGSACGPWTPPMPHVRHNDEPPDYNAPFMSPQAVGRGLRQPQSQTPQLDVCLPLLGVSIDMQVDCNIAKTKVVQTFTNHGSVSIPEAWYSFPLYDGATITAFRCEVGEDKVLEGKVKPKDEAKVQFKRAVEKQEAAALVEEMTPEVFQTTIGNIEPRSTVRVEITYVEELHHDLGEDGIVATIPTSVAPRYGTPPAGYRTDSGVKNTGISLVVSVVTAGVTKEIVCRSGHGIFIEYGKMSHATEAASFEALAALANQDDSDLSRKRTTIRLSHDQTFMDKDFILFIPSSSDGLPKSQALLAPSSGSDHVAMMVTVSPKELFADLQESMDEFDGEFLFLADRSGSMEGSKIDELKDALLVFLKSLPAKCKFNIYSFGDDVASLWPRSMQYNDSTVQQALDHVSTFEADFGGTEVLNALRKAVGDRLSAQASSTQLILLTDGEIWQADKTIDFVRTTTSEADGQIRFFCLGIGNEVSHELIQGIGFFGAGFGETVAADERGKWKGTVVNMLKGAVMPKSWSYSIQFGDEWNEKRLDMDILPYHAEGNPSQALGRLAGAADPSFIQAPRTIPRLHHFGQQSVYFLLDSTIDNLPEHVTITGCSQYGGTKTATLAVTKSASNNIMQHLAAKAAVRDLEIQDTEEAFAGRIRRNAECLCQMYSITSKWASFVAVSHLQSSAEYEDIEVSLYKAPLSELDMMIQPAFAQAGPNLPAPVDTSLGAQGQHNSEAIGASHPWAPRDQRSKRRSTAGAGWTDDPYVQWLMDEDTRQQERLSKLALKTPTKMSITKRGPFREQRRRRTKTKQNFSLPDPRPVVDYNSSHQLGSGIYEISWQELIRRQQAEGLFDLDENLEQLMAQHFCHGTREILRRRLVRHVRMSVAEQLIDTAMALSYLRSHLYSERALWVLLVQKAEGRLAAHFNPDHWARRDVLSAMTDSALLHAHIGRCLKEAEEDSRFESNRSHGRCDVCDLQDDKPLSSAQNDGRPEKCIFPDCDVLLGDGDEFWAHAFEQNHILPSCENARDRYTEASAQAQEAEACQEREKPESIDSKENQNQSTTFRGTKRMRTPTEHDEVAGGHERRITKRV